MNFFLGRTCHAGCICVARPTTMLCKRNRSRRAQLTLQYLLVTSILVRNVCKYSHSPCPKSNVNPVITSKSRSLRVCCFPHLHPALDNKQHVLYVFVVYLTDDLIRTEHNELHGMWKWSWRPWDTMSTWGEINGHTTPPGGQSVSLQKNGTGNLPNTCRKCYCYSWRSVRVPHKLIVAYLSAGYGYCAVPIKRIEFTSFNFNIILPFRPNSHKWQLPFGLSNQHYIVLISNQDFIMLKWIPVTTECRVLRLRSEETASRYWGYCKYTLNNKSRPIDKGWR
jgi:hypothetical protein